VREQASGHFTPEELDEARSRDIVDLIRADGIELRRKSGRWVGKCPFHPDGTPSFMSIPDSQRFHCHGCGVTVDPIGWMMQQRGMTFPAAMEALLGRTGSGTPNHPIQPPAPSVAPPDASTEAPPKVWDNEDAVVRFINDKMGPVERVFRFRDPSDANTLLWEFRFQPFGEPGKDVRLGTPAPHGPGIVMRCPETFVRPLYNLPRIAKMDPNEWLWMVGGPKKAEVIGECGHVGTSGSGAEIAIGKCDLGAFLRHPRRVIWRDNDDAGKTWAAFLRRAIRQSGVGGETLEVIPSELGLSRKDDVVDWLSICGGEEPSRSKSDLDYVLQFATAVVPMGGREWL